MHTISRGDIETSRWCCRVNLRRQIARAELVWLQPHRSRTPTSISATSPFCEVASSTIGTKHITVKKPITISPTMLCAYVFTDVVKIIASFIAYIGDGSDDRRTNAWCVIVIWHQWSSALCICLLISSSDDRLSGQPAVYWLMYTFDVVFFVVGCRI